MYFLRVFQSVLSIYFVFNYVTLASVIHDKISNPFFGKLIQKRAVDEVCETAGCMRAAKQVQDNLDETVNPCDDFYQFACGGYMAKHPIPEDKSSNGVFEDVKDSFKAQIKTLVERQLSGTELKYIKMLKDFYDSCTNLDRLEETGAGPLQKTLAVLGGWPVVEGDKWDDSKFDWVSTTTALRELGYNFATLTSTNVMEDLRNNTVYSIYLDQSDLGMPDRSYLVKGLSDNATAAYFNLMVKAATKLGANEDTARKELLGALEFERTLANYSRPQEERRDIDQLYNKYTLKQLNEEIPQVDWWKYINSLFVQLISPIENVIVIEPDFMKKFGQLIENTDKRTIANYMMWRVVKQSMTLLSKEWSALYQEYSAVLSGSSGEEPRWDQCLGSILDVLEVATSSYYIREYFQEESKEKALDLVNYLRKEFLKMLNNVEWMDEGTKSKAIEKANAMTPYIGYVNELSNDTLLLKYYENLTISQDNYFNNILNLNKWRVDTEYAQLRKKSIKGEWKKHANAAMVDAFYNPLENSIEFPAGILQNPFFDKDRPTYMNFGGIGYAIGHEITHGFDDMGRQFDKDGNNINWWDETTDERFRQKAECIINQYGNYTTEIGLNVNGVNTQGENIADNGGMKEAYLAYQLWVKDNGPEKKLPGLKYTPGQMFWISAANVWCANYRPEALKLAVLTDVHSPSQFRIWGPMSNLAEFSKEFECPLGSQMNPVHKCKVW